MAGRVVGRVSGVWAGVVWDDVMVAAAVVSGWGGAAGKGIGAGGAAGRGAVWLIGSAVVHATKTVNISTLRIITHSLYPFPLPISFYSILHNVHCSTYFLVSVEDKI